MTDPNHSEPVHEETEEERRARHRFDTETAAGPASGESLDDADEGTVMVDRSAAQANEPAHSQHEDHEDGTIVVDRRAAPAEHGPDDGPEDGTVVVDRTAPPSASADDDAVDDGTIMVDRSAPDDGTVVVDRTADPDPDDGTVVVDRTSDPDDGTVVVDRSAEPDDGTVVVDRSVAADDGTLVVERPAAPAKRGPVMRTLPRRGAKREVTLAPGTGANKTATLAPGAGAIAEYEKREIPAPPAATPQIELGPEASRANAPSMPSIAKQSRRRGLIALSVTAGAIVISVVGLVLVIRALITG